MVVAVCRVAYGASGREYSGGPREAIGRPPDLLASRANRVLVRPQRPLAAVRQSDASRREVLDMDAIRAAVSRDRLGERPASGIAHPRGSRSSSGRWVVLATAIVLALPLAGCGLFKRWDPLPVGTCVRASDEGEVVVPCVEPHTHRVIANVPGDVPCPPETVMWATPADEHGARITTCYARDEAGG